jgi:hypothetical protein
MNGMYLSFLIFTPRFMKFYKVVSKTTLESYCYYFLRGGLQCMQEKSSGPWKETGLLQGPEDFSCMRE